MGQPVGGAARRRYRQFRPDDEQVREMAVVDVACDGPVALDLKAEAIRRIGAHQIPEAAAWLARCRQRPSEVFGGQVGAADA